MSLPPAVCTRLRAGAGACACLLLAASLLACGDAPPARHLVFISLDTTRADHLPTYGYGRNTAPAIEALARRSAVFENAFAQSTHTSPSHTTMFTGAYPHEHGVRFNGDRLDAARVTLAQILRRAGFRTGAFVSGYTLARRASSLDGGFEVYEDDLPDERRAGRITTDRALEWLRGLECGERYFLFLHLFDPHGPYEHRGAAATLFRSDDPGPLLRWVPPYQRRIDAEGRPVRNLNAYVDAYDAMIRVPDDQVARVLEAIDLGETAVVVTADHGETLGERFFPLDHGARVFDEQIRIPLILHTPGGSPRRIPALVETTDLLPTLLGLLGVAAPPELVTSGRSLVPLLRGRMPTIRRAVFSSADAHDAPHADRGYRLDHRRRIHAVRAHRWKLIRYPGLDGEHLELYDLERDPAERRNVADAFPGVRDTYRSLIERWRGSTEVAPRPELEAEVREGLRALGYAE